VKALHSWVPMDTFLPWEDDFSLELQRAVGPATSLSPMAFLTNNSEKLSTAYPVLSALLALKIDAARI
jgi:hypothetical protein